MEAWWKLAKIEREEFEPVIWRIVFEMFKGDPATVIAFVQYVRDTYPCVTVEIEASLELMLDLVQNED